MSHTDSLGQIYADRRRDGEKLDYRHYVGLRLSSFHESAERERALGLGYDNENWNDNCNDVISNYSAVSVALLLVYNDSK